MVVEHLVQAIAEEHVLNLVDHHVVPVVKDVVQDVEMDVTMDALADVQKFVDLDV